MPTSVGTKTSEQKAQPLVSGFTPEPPVATELRGPMARLLDVAQQQVQDSIDLNLGPAYGNVRNRGAITGEIGRIARLIRDALPHHATNVRTVIVRMGQTVRWVPLGQATQAE